VREGVTNVVRHSGARNCWIALTRSSVVVADDGAGPRPGAGGGRGLAGLAERARSAGGALTVGRSPQGGFELAVRV
jgi:two-component system sensor histidine kinase DesK